MKKLFLSLFAFVICNWGQAQHLVSIPDSAFREQLKRNHPQLFTGNMLDTLSAASATIDLIVYGENVNSLEGLQYFKSMHSLSVFGTNIQQIPPIRSQAIQYLNISQNQLLSSLPLLPDSIRGIGLSDNPLVPAIPTLPKALEYLTLYALGITQLPSLPNSLEFLSCTNNSNLKCLGYLPASLTYLNSDVSCISNRPMSLTGSNLQLCSLTNNSNNCPISSKPVVYGYLYLDDNANGMMDSTETKFQNTGLYIEPVNQTVYTNADGKYFFEADTNLVYTITAQTIAGYQGPAPVQIQKLPLHANVQENLGFRFLTVPSQPVVYGKVYYDLNQNNQLDTTDVAAPNKEIRIQPGDIVLYSDNNGAFEYTLDSAQTFTIFLESDSLNRIVLSNLKPNSRNYVSIPIHFNQGYLIPDSAFRSQLKNQFPNCFVGELLDTTCALVARNPYGWGIHLTGDSIKSIEGIRFFKSITSLSISQTSIKVIPDLPESITYLSIYYNNQLETIHRLPDSLNRFSAYYNPRLNFDQLADLPDGLTDLYCFNNNISQFPMLPRGLKYFSCSKNSMTSLPTIPDSLVSLDCSLNQLTSITGLISPTLRTVNFSSNNISECPAFGKNLQVIECQQNPFSCLKTLPDSLVYIDTDVKCLPNIPSRLTTFLSSTTGAKLALCNPTNNPYNCQVNPTVQGRIFYDLNNNQTYDAGDVVATNQKINLAPTGSYTFSDSLGNFIIDIDTVGQYVLSLATVPYFISSPSVTVNGFGLNVSTTVNFYYTKTADVKDIAVVLTPYQAAARPGFPFSMDVTVRNNGTIPTTAQVAFQLPAAYSISGIVFPNCSTTSANIPCSLGTLLPGQTIRGLVEGRIRTTASLGDSISFVAEVNGGDVSDANPTNNVSLTNFIVRGSYDPNDKAGTALDPRKVGQSQWIDYTIRFQNTGTDTAFTVVVADSLPSELIPSTVEILSVSHAYEFSKTVNVLYFRFNNILLADSNTNEKASHGFIKFRIKAISSLPLSASIRNRAAIYFDYNAPVITDYAISSFISPARVTVIATAEQTEAATYVYPNPVANGRLFVPSGVQNDYQLFNSSGFVVAKGKIEENGIDVSSLPAGIYLLHLGNHKEKVVIE